VVVEFVSEQRARECIRDLVLAGISARLNLTVVDPGLPGVLSFARAIWSVQIDAADSAAARGLLLGRGEQPTF
jgi:hypothetical protein